MVSEPVQLYSIGHSNIPVERLIALLRQHAIATLCDVRSAPYSRYSPQFNRENLAEDLRVAAIAYHFMGDSLGGKPTDGALRTEDGALPDYAKIAASPAFVRGLDHLIALGARRQTAFMCSEADYHACHRHRLIAPALIDRGVAVWHILPDGLLERGVIEPQQTRMFDDDDRRTTNDTQRVPGRTTRVGHWSLVVGRFNRKHHFAYSGGMWGDA